MEMDRKNASKKVEKVLDKSIDKRYNVKARQGRAGFERSGEH